MTPSGAIALYGAALPFVMPWKGLVPKLQVLSLERDPAPEWELLLAGQGIDLRPAARALPQDCTVLTGFDVLDTATPQTLGAQVSQAVQALRPGGLLILGQTGALCNDTGTGIDADALQPAQVARLLKNAGFARQRLLFPVRATKDIRPDGIHESYVIVAQMQAHGASFDVFSPVFSDTPVTPESPLQTHVRQTEASVLARLHQAEAVLHNCIDVLNDRLLRSEADLQAAVARLERVTRRRGLRNLVYRLKQKWRARATHIPSNIPSDGTSPQNTTVLQPAASSDLPDTRAMPRTRDPVPLSPRETDLYQQLFDAKAD